MIPAGFVEVLYRSFEYRGPAELARQYGFDVKTVQDWARSLGLFYRGRRCNPTRVYDDPLPEEIEIAKAAILAERAPLSESHKATLMRAQRDGGREYHGYRVRLGRRRRR